MFYRKFATIISVKISAVIITKNEADKIARAIESLTFADEILVIDSDSRDATREIASALGARVIIQKWLGFSAQKQLATDAAQYDWIFSLDADEEVSPELQKTIGELKNTDEKNLAAGYRLSRLTFYMNRPIRHGGWYPDWQLRFFDRRRGFWKNVRIHESVQMDEKAQVTKLPKDIYHYSIDDAAHHHRIIGERYARLAAEQMYENGRRTGAFKIAAAGMTAFLQTYLLKAGFMDGLPGYCIARFAAQNTFLKYLYLFEFQQKNKSNPPDAGQT